MLSLGRKILVDSYVRYSTDRALEKNGDDWSALKIRCVVKGESFKYNLFLPINGTQTSFYNNQSALVEDELLKQCSIRLKLAAPGGCVIVPVPNSNATVPGDEFKTFEHARAIAAKAGSQYTVLPALLWKQVQEKSHKGGKSRSYMSHLHNMYVACKAAGPIVLYDDVVTTGSQLAASRELLTQAGMNVVGMIVVVSVLSADGCTHSDIGVWKSETRMCF